MPAVTSKKEEELSAHNFHNHCSFHFRYPYKRKKMEIEKEKARGGTSAGAGAQVRSVGPYTNFVGSHAC